MRMILGAFALLMIRALRQGCGSCNGLATGVARVMLSVSDQGAFPPCPAPFNLAAHVLARAHDLADKTALQIVDPNQTESWTYSRLEAAVRGCGTGLLRLGLNPGDRILMRLGNTADFPVLYLGAIAAGLVPVPTFAQLTAPEISRMAAIIAPALIVGDHVALPDPLPCPVLSAPALAEMFTLPPCNWALGDPDRLAYIIFTSGSSGLPKAVCHAHRAIWARRMMHQDWYGLLQTDRLMHAGAFNWTFTLGTGLLDPWTAGATALIPGPAVTPLDLPALMRRYAVTIFAAAPGVYRQILRQPVPPLAHLRHGLSAGEKLPGSVRAAWTNSTGTRIHEAFGMSECSTFISSSPSRPAPTDSIGYPQPGRRLAVLGPEGPVPRGAAGVLAVDAADPGLFLGYMNDHSYDVGTDAWFLTGDTVSMGEDDAITYIGREDDMMTAGGFRVSPIEIETVVLAHPAVRECAVRQVEVKPGTSVISCFYVASKPIDKADLFEFAAQNLARYKCPRQYIELPELPRGPNNKLLRRALRAPIPQEGT